MQLIEALRIIRDSRAEGGDSRSAWLCCGFTPLHLSTLLQAHLSQRLESAVDLESGLFGDLIGNLDQAIRQPAERTAVLVEWSDLDPRLGYRSSRGWRPDSISDIVDSASHQLARLKDRVTALSEVSIVAVCLPTLPLPPLFNSPGIQTDSAAAQLRRFLAAFAEDIAGLPSVGLVDSQQLELCSPLSQRHDPASDLRTGFPYSMSHAAMLAQSFALLLLPAPVLKGIITDLDHTFWHGIVGEDGINGVSWHLDKKSHQHALYQEMLASLSDLGALVAVASKNSADIVDQALQRDDLVCPRDRMFPVEANWGAKSASVQRILDTWNVAADSVVFIDDSSIELAEVAENVPGIHCCQFNGADEASVLNLLRELRDLFGKKTVTAEDRIRRDSLKSSSTLTGTETDVDSFLSRADATITLAWNEPDQRCLELINKTNQFNLNGRRIDEAQWRKRLAQDDSFLVAVSYEDKFGPLGKISVVAGWIEESQVVIDCWVQSCRAFSRRIEHVVVGALLERFKRPLAFDFVATDRNGPLQAVLIECTGDPAETGPILLDSETFASRSPALFAKVINHDAAERHSHAA